MIFLRSLLVSVLLACAIAGVSQAWIAQKPAGGAGNNTAVDCGGAACPSSNGSGTSLAVTLSTTASSGRIFVAVLNNGARVSSVTATGLTFTQRIDQSNGGAACTTTEGACLSFITAPFSAQQVSKVITVNNSASAGFMTVHAFAISGENGFDTNGSLPATSFIATVSLSTSNANDMLVCVYRYLGTASPTQGTGMTLVLGNNYMLTEVKQVTATQSGFVCPSGTGTGDENVGIGDAVKSS